MLLDIHSYQKTCVSKGPAATDRQKIAEWPVSFDIKNNSHVIIITMFILF